MTKPIFELHIAPLFRLLDRSHMRAAIDLTSYEDVVKHAGDILKRVATDMPTVQTGGPWPPEFVAIFKRWMDEGFKRLELGSANLTLSDIGGRSYLIAAGVYPAAGYRGWLQLESESPSELRFALYFDKPDAPSSGSAGKFQMRERFTRAQLQKIVVRHAAGESELQVTPAPVDLALFEKMGPREFYST
jgi:hypothetical protein